MNIKAAQNDLRIAYFGGAPGILASGLIWTIAAITAMVSTAQTSIIVFFFGGMLIHPLGIIISKICKRSARHAKGNPLAVLALESTILLFIGLFIAYLFFQFKQDWFFSIMLLIIGGRYMLFQTMYGIKTYWILGIILIAAGVLCLVFNQAIHIAAIIGGVTELFFSVLIFISEKGSEKVAR